MRTLRARTNPPQNRGTGFFKTDTVMISERAISALGRAGIKGPIEDGLRNLVMRHLNWKSMLKGVHLCGDRTIREIEAAARGLGYDTSVKMGTRAAKALRRHDVMTVEDLRRFMLANGDWRAELKATDGCGRRTMGEIVVAAQQLGIL